jgi:hypothetical protein
MLVARARGTSQIVVPTEAMESIVSTKFRVTFDVDLGKISPDELANGTSNEAVHARKIITRLLLASNRKASLREMQRIRTATQLTAAEKSQMMAECLRRAQVSMMAEANLEVTALPMDAVIHDDTEERISIAA